MANCGQAYPYNTLDGCKVKEYNAICPLTNMATPVTEYRMTNADRIRAMSDEELAKWLCSISTAECCDRSCPARDICDFHDNGMIKWLKQPAEGADNG